ncbi:MAG TPA: hypothetical protein ENK60_06890 [Anaerolineae bacterium]|nr:hypothetical protein [Anaerolineae bacterium]
MPERASIERICPYVRGRQGVDPVPEPSVENHCLLAASIYLPLSHQREYCLSGRFASCSRYQRQQGRPIPRYVRGAKPVPVRPTTPAPDLKPLPWRQPWFATTLKWLALLALFLLFLAFWRIRMRETPPFILDRNPVPSPVIEVTPTIPPAYLPPTVGPPG